MNASTWQRAKKVLDDARVLGTASREAFLDLACRGDKELRTEVEKLLGSYDSDFLEENPLNAVEALIEPALPTGQTIGRYRIKKLIGSGGMGQVFLADDTELDRPVAVKILHSDVATDQDRLRRFTQEARAASALNHPNILTIHEIGSFGGSRFIVSEYIDGCTLRQRMLGGLTVSESLDITSQIATALQAAHSAGIVHRDIKPENIMLRRDGLVKVLDFGLAKLTEADDLPVDPSSSKVSRVQTGPGLVMGTVAYMSPEQARGQAVDARADLWSLGVVLHEMLTGRSPFEGDSVTDLISSILKNESTIANLNDLPSVLRPICTKALAKDKDFRYRSAHDLLKDLQGEKKKMEYAIESKPYIGLSAADALKTQLIRRRPTLSAENIVTEIKRHKYATLFAAALIVFFAVGLSVYKFSGATPQGGNEAVLPAITLATTERDLKMSRLPTSGKVFEIAISPDGKHVAYVGGEDREKSPIRLRERETGNEVELVPAPTSGSFNGLLFTPDANYLYYALSSPGGGTIYRVPSNGGPSAKIVDDTDGGGTISPDGKLLAFARIVHGAGTTKDSEDYILANADGTNERVIVHANWNAANRFECDTPAAWSTDGKQLACTQHYEESGEVYDKLVALTLSDGSKQELSDKKWRYVNGKVWLANRDLIITASELIGATRSSSQIWFISPGSPPRQITNGFTGYDRISATVKGDILATVQSDSKIDLWLAPQNDTSKAKQITSSGELGNGLDWMQDGRIVFSSRGSEAVDVWTMNADGTGRKQLTSGAGFNRWPVVSRDGRYIVFLSTRSRTVEGDDHVFRMDADGRNVKQLTNGKREWSPKISPDGKWVYYIQVYEDRRPKTIYKVPIDGGEPVVVATMPDADGRTDMIDVAPDGRIVYEMNRWITDHRERTLYIISPIGGKPVNTFRLPLTATEVGWTYFRWTPDGKSIAFNDSRDGGANVWTIPADGKGKEKPLTNFGIGSRAARFTWSPDGKRFLVARANSTSDGILISKADQH